MRELTDWYRDRDLDQLWEKKLTQIFKKKKKEKTSESFKQESIVKKS